MISEHVWVRSRRGGDSNSLKQSNAPPQYAREPCQTSAAVAVPCYISHRGGSIKVRQWSDKDATCWKVTAIL